MLNYKDVVVEENTNQVWWCRLVEDDGEYLYRMQIQDTYNSSSSDMVLYHVDINSDKEYREEDVLTIESLCEDTEMCQSDWEEIPINRKELEPYKHSEDVYKFSNKQELLEIYKHLNEPIIVDTLRWNDSEWLKNLTTNIYGVVFYWTEYDDYSCGHPYSYKMKIIFNIKEA